MLRWVLLQARFRLGVGVACALSMPLVLPSAPSQRIWVLSLAAVLMPLMVIGREAQRRRSDMRAALQLAPHAGRLVGLEVLPALTVASLACALGTGNIAATLTLVAWAMALTLVADGVDRATGQAGAAWVVAATVAVVAHLAPVLLAPAFGAEPTTPWVLSSAVAMHPAGAALAAAGLPTLQDPIFYTFTLSGVLEARPMSWFWGAGAFLSVAILAFGRALRVARRAPRVIR